jgi:hypothetical protein
MGGFLSGILGTDSQYQASPYQSGNPYSQTVLQDELSKQAEVYRGQQALAQALQQQMNGNGPNPAQTQYQQNVQNNVANAQGLINSQRGLNPALAARMGSNAASAANQQAAMQSSLLNQQQQLGATQNLGNLYGQMQQGNIGQQALYTQAHQGAMQTNAAVANANQQAAQGIVGGLLNSAGPALGVLAHGGMVKGYADGGMTDDPQAMNYSSMTEPASNRPQSQAGKFLKGFDSMGNTNAGNVSPVLTQGFGSLGAMGANPALSAAISGSKRKPMSMPLLSDPKSLSAVGGAAEFGPEMAMVAAHGGRVPVNFKPGGKVPGKAAVKGDSFKNDTVPAIVSPGEIVLPRSITMSNDAPERAKKFVAAILAKRSMRK